MALVGTETLKILQAGFPVSVPATDIRTFINPITKILAADITGTNGATAQQVFTSAGSFNAQDRTTYKFEAIYMINRAAGVTSHTTGVLFGGTATFTAIDYLAEVSNPTGNILSAASHFVANAATSLVITAANTSATENLRIRLTGVMRINVGGTIIPQFIYSAAPGGAPTIKRGTYFEFVPLGTRDAASFGTGWV